MFSPLKSRNRILEVNRLSFSLHPRLRLNLLPGPQVLNNVIDTEPLTRNAVIRTMAEQEARIELVDCSGSRGPLCAQHADSLIMTYDQSMRLESELKALSDAAAGAARGFDSETAELCFATGVDDASAPGNRWDSSRLASALEEYSAQGPNVMDLQLDSGGLIEMLNRGGGIELWCENRC